MPDKFLQMTPELHRYVIDHGSRQDDVLARVQRETDEMGDIAIMQISPDQGAFMELLTRLVRAERALEIGTFTGYSAICVARGLSEGGELVCLELSAEYAATARRNLDEAGVGDRVEIMIGPALDSLRAMPAEPTFDIAFIDAHKPEYVEYYEETLSRLNPGGLMLLDNVLFFGLVLDPPADAEGVQVLAKLNELIVADERVDVAMLSVADGLTLVRKR